MEKERVGSLFDALDVIGTRISKPRGSRVLWRAVVEVRTGWGVRKFSGAGMGHMDAVLDAMEQAAEFVERQSQNDA